MSPHMLVTAKPCTFMLLPCHVDLLSQQDLPNLTLHHLVSIHMAMTPVQRRASSARQAFAFSCPRVAIITLGINFKQVPLGSLV